MLKHRHKFFDLQKHLLDTVRCYDVSGFQKFLQASLCSVVGYMLPLVLIVLHVVVRNLNVESVRN